MEVQALEAIYGDDYKKLDDPPNSFEVTLVPEAGADEDVNHVSIALRITYTPTYPEAAPELSVRPVRRGGLTDDGLAECEKLLREAAVSEEVLGTAMVYVLAEKCIEWLVEHNKPEMDMHTEMMERLKAQEVARGDDEEEVDVSDGAGGGRGKLREQAKGARKAGGTEGSWRADVNAGPADDGTHTPVTKESFALFRKEWEAQRAAAKEAKEKKLSKAAGRNAAADSYLSGRQLFERSGAGALDLIDADAGALEEGEDDVMCAPREAAEPPGGEGADESGEGGGPSGSMDVALLDTVGDEALFEDDDEDLPDDED